MHGEWRSSNKDNTALTKSGRVIKPQTVNVRLFKLNSQWATTGKPPTGQQVVSPPEVAKLQSPLYHPPHMGGKVCNTRAEQFRKPKGG